jgi:hypothetical protein
VSIVPACLKREADKEYDDVAGTFNATEAVAAYEAEVANAAVPADILELGNATTLDAESKKNKLFGAEDNTFSSNEELVAFLCTINTSFGLYTIAICQLY